MIPRPTTWSKAKVARLVLFLAMLLSLLLSCPLAPAQSVGAAGLPTVQNGLYQGQDPWVWRKDGYYYLSQSGPYGPTALYVSRSRSLADQGEKVKVYQANGNLYRIFAPELHYLQGKWYIYACADVVANNNVHHAVVFEGTTQNPQDPFVYKGVLYTGTAGKNYSANDFTVFQVGAQLYATWGTMDLPSLPDPHGHTPAIARMASPTQITEDRSFLPQNGGEGPRVLQRNGKTFITVSMGGWATQGYHLGMYTNSDGNLLNTASWTFRDNLFNTTSEVWGPGRAAFTKSADGSEDWMIYHSKIYPANDNGWRQVNIQKFTWNADGTPNFGTPASPFTKLTLPAGDPGLGDVYQAENAALAGGAGKNTNNAGYTGAGFVDRYYAVGTSTTFTVNVPQSGHYLVTLRYGNGVYVAEEQKQWPTIEPPAPGTLSVYVNGAKIRQTRLEKTTDWAHWMLQTEKLSLNAGNNTISYRIDSGDTGYVTLDYIAVQPLVPHPPAASSTVRTYEAEGAGTRHGLGRIDGDGWSANVTQDGTGHLIYGPYATDIPAGANKAIFRMMIDNNSVNTEQVATVEVNDATAGTIIASLPVYRHQFTHANTYQEIALPFSNVAGRSLEFRVWYADKAYVKVDKVTIRNNVLRLYEAEGAGMGHARGRLDGAGWSANVTQDSTGHMIYGPYVTDIPSGSNRAVFRMMIDNNTLNAEQVATIEVNDATTGAIIASQPVYRNQFTGTMAYQDFTLPFNSAAWRSLEFRVWYADKAYLKVDRITVRQ